MYYFDFSVSYTKYSVCDECNVVLASNKKKHWNSEQGIDQQAAKEILSIIEEEREREKSITGN